MPSSVGAGRRRSGPRDARSFDISNDGERFLLVRERSGVERLHVVLNWLSELERLVPID